jgi:hypothetical protein
MELIVGIIVEVIIMTFLNSIGAWVRSLFSKNRDFSMLLNDKPIYNALIGLALNAVLVLVILWII